MAHAIEDSSKKFIEFVDGLEVPEASNTYNITGKSAAHVIAILKSIVNNREWPYGYIKATYSLSKLRSSKQFRLHLKRTQLRISRGMVESKEMESDEVTKILQKN